jgi:hypothetical protein
MRAMQDAIAEDIESTEKSKAKTKMQCTVQKASLVFFDFDFNFFSVPPVSFVVNRLFIDSKIVPTLTKRQK